MKMFTDIQLIELIRGSDNTAMNQLYSRYWKLLYKLAIQKTGNPSEAEDIVQELFIDIWNKRQTLQLRTTLRSYLVSCLYYQVFKYFRNQGVKERHAQNFGNFLQNNGKYIQEAGETLTSFEIEYIDMQQVIARIIDAMPLQMKKIFLLRKRDRLSIAEIAGMLELSPLTVKKQLSNAMSRLRAEAKTKDGSSSTIPDSRSACN